MWWSGPAFLSKSQEEWPSQEVDPSLNTEDPEVKKSSEAVFVIQVGSDRLLDPARYSSWLRYKRIIAWVMRFAGNLKRKRNGDDQSQGPLTSSEMQAAEVCILKESQRLAYPAEFKVIASGAVIPTESPLSRSHHFWTSRD